MVAAGTATTAAAPRSSAWMRWLWLSALVIALDQWSKQQIVTAFAARSTALQLTSWFDLVLAYNRGAAFSVLNQGGDLPRVLFSGIAVVASAALVWLIRTQAGQWPTQLGGALILGGALGNLVDRIRLGAVVDFIQWHLGEAYWPAFNVADSAITLGASVLVLHSLRSSGASR
jgi:signal peptidase II